LALWTSANSDTTNLAIKKQTALTDSFFYLEFSNHNTKMENEFFWNDFKLKQPPLVTLLVKDTGFGMLLPLAI